MKSPKGPTARAACWFALVCAVALSTVGLAQTPPSARPDEPTPDGPSADTLHIERCLGLPRIGTSARHAVFTDPIQAQIAKGTWTPPALGDSVVTSDSTAVTWAAFDADDEGWIYNETLAGGYAAATVEAPVAGAYLLDALGPGHVYVNGVPRVGDVYQRGFLRLPVWLEAGPNTLLFRERWGALRAKLYPPPAPLFIEERDPTFPTVLEGAPASEIDVGIVVSNATQEWRHDLALITRMIPPSGTGFTSTVQSPGRASGARTAGQSNPVGSLPPLRTRKVPARVSIPEGWATGADSLIIQVELRDGHGDLLHQTQFPIDVATPSEKHYRSFVSGIDGSVQHYGVTPPPARPDTSVGLILTLHGAGVPARQAHHYAARDWAYIVSPTNRREFGFDWEDWGRTDALEVFREVERLFSIHPAQRWLTGHSMGGHGTWNLGSLFPDRFGALGPSAGWRDFWSYGSIETSGAAGPIELVLARSANLSRTLLFERNLLHQGIYILHGDLDDNVPVEQARYMRERLGTFHPNFAYYERPGAGHWWGDECMDWPPLIDFLRRNPIADSRTIAEIDFTTVDPAVSWRCYWAGVETQERSFVPSRVFGTLDRDSLTFTLETTNVKRLLLDFSAVLPETLDAPIEVTCEIDGQRLQLSSPHILRYMMQKRTDEETADFVSLERIEGSWALMPSLDLSRKGPHRGGTFKQAFDHRVLLVVGTEGDDAETAWAMNKALYDAETFYYRGNGAIEVFTDHEFLEALSSRPGAMENRNLVLYGNTETNAALGEVLDPRCPIELHRGALMVGSNEWLGDDLAGVFVFPRRNSDLHSVAVIGGTGLVGARTLDQMPYFVSGAGFPDWMVVRHDMLEHGIEGVLGAGFFTDEWELGDDYAVRGGTSGAGKR